MLGSYLFRKLIYTVATAAVFGIGGYLAPKTDIKEWTMPGVAGAAIAGVMGALFSAPLGGTLKKD